MPVYEYQGKHYELETKDPAEAKSKIMAHLGGGTKKEPTFGEQATAAGKSALESAGGAAGGYAGAELGAMAGAPLGPLGILGGGLAGGIAGYYGGEKLQEKASEYIPESVKKATGFDPEQRAKERKEMPTASTIGKYAPDVAAVAPSLARLTKFGYTSAKELASSFKKPPPIAEAEGLDVVGEKGFDLVKKKAEKLYEAKKAEAEEKYADAYNTAREAQAKGQPFATSPQGMALLQSLEKEKSVLAGGEKFARGEEKIAGINRLINAIKGTKTGGERVAKEIPRVGQTPGKIFKTTPAQTTEKDIEAIVEELRFLRDVDAKGKPYEAYASLDAKYKRDLISKLESALYDWNNEYRLADEAYKAASQKLAPYKTQLMSNALKGEKFNPKDLVASPEEFGPKFFSDVDGVRQLKAVTQDPAAVNQLGKEYVASLLSNKTPQQIQAFVKDPKNAGWLRESGILEDVTKYANQAEKAASRQEILSNLKRGALYGIGAATIGGPAFYGARRALGI